MDILLPSGAEPGDGGAECDEGARRGDHHPSAHSGLALCFPRLLERFVRESSPLVWHHRLLRRLSRRPSRWHQHVLATSTDTGPRQPASFVRETTCCRSPRHVVPGYSTPSILAASASLPMPTVPPKLAPQPRSHPVPSGLVTLNINLGQRRVHHGL